MDVEFVVGSEEQLLVVFDDVVLELSWAEVKLERAMRVRGARMVVKRILKECIKLD